MQIVRYLPLSRYTEAKVQSKEYLEKDVFYQYLSTTKRPSEHGGNLVSSVREILRIVPPAAHDERAMTVLNRFLEEPTLHCLPVLKEGRVCGLINRHRFMEKSMVGKFGFGHSLNYYKPAEALLESDFLQVDLDTTIEQAAGLIQARDHDRLYDDICVASNEQYAGIVSVSDLLAAVTRNSLILAIGANPLTGLPGNDCIQREIRGLLAASASFDICYIDIDYFKPFNDRYGFARGDEVIKTVAEIMLAELARYDQEAGSFAGHIGGDDFILVTKPEYSLAVCRSVIAHFDRELSRFHGEDEVKSGFYESLSRKGEIEQFPLVSLSIAIVSTEQRLISSYAEIASIASDLKKKAKQQPGSVVLRDQRRNGRN